MKGKLLKKGDKVVMHTCLESEGKNYGKIWACAADEFTKGKGVYKQNLVFLEGFSGYFTTEYLQKVNIGKEMPKKVIKTKTSSQACPVCKHNVNWNYCPNCGQKIKY